LLVPDQLAGKNWIVKTADLCQRVLVKYSHDFSLLSGGDAARFLRVHVVVSYAAIIASPKIDYQ
jgi:hypothetical protein